MFQSIIALCGLCLLLTLKYIYSYNTITPQNSNDSVPYSTRVHWMRVTNQALLDLVSPCPSYAFGTAIVNHTGDGLGELVCIGVNEVPNTGNPSMHGEMAAIANCTSILTAKNGRYGLNTVEAISAFSQLSLYTNAESCPMCASAIRWSGFKEYIYGTSISTLIKAGWRQIKISSEDVFSASVLLQPSTKLISNILSNETDPFFKWQYNCSYPCPTGCRRTESGESCVVLGIINGTYRLCGGFGPLMFNVPRMFFNKQEDENVENEQIAESISATGWTMVVGAIMVALFGRSFYSFKTKTSTTSIRTFHRRIL